MDLYDNQIKQLDVTEFENMKQLKILDLSFNQFKEIPKLQLPSLQQLYFVNNKIKKIQNLEGVPSLTLLELGSNRIREIENLDSLQNLQELWLGTNKIVELKVCFVYFCSITLITFYIESRKFTKLESN